MTHVNWVVMYYLNNSSIKGYRVVGRMQGVWPSHRSVVVLLRFGGSTKTVGRMNPDTCI
jgi:hypothetical protein